MAKAEYSVMTEGKLYPVVVSDEQAVLLAAKAAGRAVIGVYDPGCGEKAPFGVPYLIEKGAEISESFLERIVRRHLGLPWIIAETGRLLLREFTSDDWKYLDKQEREDFGGQAGFLAYVSHQYSFYEYGMWAVVEKAGQSIIGMAGVKNLEGTNGGRCCHGETSFAPGEEEKAGDGARDKRENDAGDKREDGAGDKAENSAGDKTEGSTGDKAENSAGNKAGDGAEDGFVGEALEIGYRIHRPFRRKGYGEEAVKAVADYVERNIGCPLYARIREENIPSRQLAIKAGFTALPGQSGARIRLYRYGQSQK